MLFFLVNLNADIDINKEITKLYEAKGEEWLANDCDAAIYTLVGLNMQIAYLEKYFREVKAQQTFAFCGDEQMVKTFSPTDEVLMDFVFDALVDFNNVIPEDVASCGTNRNIENRAKELFFEPHAFKAFIHGTFSYLRGLSLSNGSSAVDLALSIEEKNQACKALYKDPEFTMPPSWLD